MNKFFLIFSCILTFLTCTKKTETADQIAVDSMRTFIDNYKFERNDSAADYYFKALLDGQQISYPVDKKLIQLIDERGTVTYSNNGVLNPSGPAAYYLRIFGITQFCQNGSTKLQIWFYGPWSKTTIGADSLMRLCLESKRKMFYAKNYSDSLFYNPNDTLSLSLLVGMSNCNLFPYQTTVGTQTNGDQTGSYLKIKKVVKTSNAEFDLYDVTFQFACMLYSDFNPQYRFKNLTNGELSVQIALPHK